MTVTNRVTQVIGGFSVVGNNVELTHNRIGSYTVAVQTLAKAILMRDPSPSFPPADPKKAERIRKEYGGQRAGRSGSCLNSLASRGLASSDRSSVLSRQTLRSEPASLAATRQPALAAAGQQASELNRKRPVANAISALHGMHRHWPVAMRTSGKAMAYSARTGPDAGAFTASCWKERNR